MKFEGIHIGFWPITLFRGVEVGQVTTWLLVGT